MGEIKLTQKQVRALKLTSGQVGMYPGIQWDFRPKQFNRLRNLGLVTEYFPHNPIHKVYATITDKGKELLRELGHHESK